MNPDGDENQNNLSGVPNADPTQQGIFTPEVAPQPAINQPQDQQAITGTVVEPTPRPTVDVLQDQPTITGTVVEPAQTGLSHPYLSNHPTQSFASGVGDIVIENSTKTKGRKKLLLITIAIVLVLIVVAILTIVASVTQNNATTSPLDTTFTSYSNYLYFGNDSTSVSDEAIPFYKTYTYRALSKGSSEREEFIRHAIEKFNVFVENSEQYELLSGSVATARDQLDVAKTYAEIGMMTSIDMTVLIDESGEVGLNEYVMTRYSGMLEKDNDLLSRFARSEIALAEAVIADDMIDVSMLENDINEIFRQIVINLINSCRNIESILAEGVQ